MSSITVEMGLDSDHEPYVDYNGRRYRTPFFCMCCGTSITIQQFAFSTLCPSCDTGNCQHVTLHPPFDPSTIHSELINPEYDEIKVLMRKIGYS